MAENNDLEVMDVHTRRRKCRVEIVPPPGITAVLESQCYELEPVLKPTDIVSDKQRFRVRVTWQVEGDLRRHLCGTWCVTTAWESCGDFPEGHRTREIPFNPCGDGRYELDFDFEPGDLTASDCGVVYCFCVTLGSKVVCEDATYTGLIFGFCKDVCCIQVRKG